MLARKLYLHNSLGRKLQEFTPLHPGRVGLYSCGPTVYNYAHVGNVRAYIFVDTLRRVLQCKGFDVLHVMNITDVGHLTSDMDFGEDKMEVAAQREGRTVWDIAAFYTDAFRTDLKRLNIFEPSKWARATDHIQEMINFARVIEENGYAYPLDDGLYFDTGRLPDYGRLALLDLDGLREGARVQAKEGKRSPTDFALWRLSPADTKRLMEWHSPWGVGAPGWHLECSTMSLKYLGHGFDIHTGGIDHRQVHHVNEIAQNEAYLGEGNSGANFWLHNEFVLFGDERMSKSSGRFLRLQDIIDRGIHPLAYRMFVLTATYRSPLRLTDEALVAGRQGLERAAGAVSRLRERAGDTAWLERLGEARYSSGAALDGLISYAAEPLSDKERLWIDRLDEAISQDLNTPQVLSNLFQLTSDDSLHPDAALRLAGIYDLVLGLGLTDLDPADLSLRPKDAAITEEEVQALIAERREARAARDFERADRIRDELADKGVVLKDTPGGTEWEWKPGG